ncbi:MAG: hypothetical protein KC619_02765, partial [Myxococcales bacterium]|nr:hypothetical protein [Myxococcales bacterium]
NCRAPYSEEEIREAFERFTREPMLHPPSVAPVGDGRFQLVTGFLRFEVMRRQGWDRGWFRIVSGSELDLYLWNLAENTARRALKGYELVERVWMLHGRGVPKDRLAQACGFKVRYLNRLLFIRRRAHPELYEAFRQGHPLLTIPRMARLVGHEPAEQMEEFRRAEALLDEATAIEQGFSPEGQESDSKNDEPPSGYRAIPPSCPRRTRRRLPPRRQVRQLLEVHERAAGLNPQYRRGVVAALRHLLDGEPLPESVAGNAREPIPSWRRPAGGV